MRTYTVHRTACPPPLNADWTDPAWTRAEALQIDRIRPESSDHHPSTQARLLYDDDRIHGIYRVKDRYVRCVRHTYQDSVCKDSCVEFFFQPAQSEGYFNFEFNCGGTLLCHFTTVQADGKRQRIEVPEEEAARVGIAHSLPERVEPEIADPTEWTLQFSIPFDLLYHTAPGMGTPADGPWRANFYKCGDDTSHPHWVAWSPVTQKNFHMPECFGELCFDGGANGN